MQSREISISPNGISRLRIPSGSQLQIISPPGPVERKADEVDFPNALKRLNPGYLSRELSQTFDIDFGGLRGVTQDLILTYDVTAQARGLAQPGATFQVASTDVAQSFSDVQLLVNDRPATEALISCLGNDIRFAFVSDPDQVDAGHTLPAGGLPIRIAGFELLRNFNFISAAAATPGTLNVTMLGV